MNMSSSANRDFSAMELEYEPKYDVFISYSGAQANFAEQLCVDLERCGRYCFFDRRLDCFPTGTKFPEKIFAAIKQCKVGVVVLSDEFFSHSKWPMLELAAFMNAQEQNARLKILPVFLGIEPNECSDVLNRRRWISKWTDWAMFDKKVSIEEWERALRWLVTWNGLVLYANCSQVKFRGEIVAGICELVQPRYPKVPFSAPTGEVAIHRSADEDQGFVNGYHGIEFGSMQCEVFRRQGEVSRSLPLILEDNDMGRLDAQGLAGEAGVPLDLDNGEQQRESLPFEPLKLPRKEKRKRNSNWSREETAVLVKCKKEIAGDNRSRFCKGKPDKTDWEAIAAAIKSELGALAIDKTADQCRFRWDNLVKSYKRINDHCMSSRKQFSELSKMEMADLKLATTQFEDEWYSVIDQIHQRKSHKSALRTRNPFLSVDPLPSSLSGPLNLSGSSSLAPSSLSGPSSSPGPLSTSDIASPEIGESSRNELDETGSTVSGAAVDAHTERFEEVLGGYGADADAVVWADQSRQRIFMHTLASPNPAIAPTTYSAATLATGSATTAAAFSVADSTVSRPSETTASTVSIAVPSPSVYGLPMVSVVELLSQQRQQRSQQQAGVHSMVGAGLQAQSRPGGNIGQGTSLGTWMLQPYLAHLPPEQSNRIIALYQSFKQNVITHEDFVRETGVLLGEQILVQIFRQIKGKDPISELLHGRRSLSWELIAGSNWDQSNIYQKAHDVIDDFNLLPVFYGSSGPTESSNPEPRKPRKQVPIPGFNSMARDLKCTLLILIQAWSTVDFDYDLDEVCRWLAIVQYQSFLKIRVHVLMLLIRNIVTISTVNERSCKLKLACLQVYQKFVEKVVRKNPHYNIHSQMWRLGDEKVLTWDSFSMITTLTLYKHEKLEKIDLGNLFMLRSLVIKECWKLEKIYGWESLRQLGWLEIRMCSSYHKFPELHYMPSLIEVVLEASVLSNPPTFHPVGFKLKYGTLGNLRRLVILGDKYLKESGDVSTLKSLKELGFCGCDALKSIDGLNGVRSLEVLNLTECRSLTSLPDLGDLRSLRVLNLTECRFLRSLPDFGHLTSLSELNMSYTNVEDISGLGSLHLLTYLELRGCKALTRLPYLGNLKALHYLDVSETKVDEIPGVHELVNLKKLLCWNSKLEWLPNLQHLNRLEVVAIGGTPLSHGSSPMYFGKEQLKFEDKEVSDFQDSDSSGGS